MQKMLHIHVRSPFEISYYTVSLYDEFIVFRLLLTSSDLMGASLLIGLKEGANVLSSCRACHLLGYLTVTKKVASKYSTRSDYTNHHEPRSKWPFKLLRPDHDIIANPEPNDHDESECQKVTYYFPMAKPENYIRVMDFSELSFLQNNVQINHIQASESRSRPGSELHSGLDNDTRFTVSFRIPIREIAYDAMNLPMQTHDTFMLQAKYIEILRESGAFRTIREVSKILKVTTIPILFSRLDVPRFLVPFFSSIDFMHFISENAKHFVLIWTSSLEGNVPILSEADRKQIDNVLENHCIMPSSWGRKTRALFSSSGPESYKSTEWFNFVLNLSPVLLNYFLPRVHYIGWMHFVTICQLALLKTFNREKDGYRIQKSIYLFFEYFNKHIYKRKYENLHHCRLYIHYVAHIWQNIEAVGPMWIIWKYPCEKYIEMITPMIRNPKLPYTSLISETEREIKISLAFMQTGCQRLNELSQMVDAEKKDVKIFILTSEYYSNSIKRFRLGIISFVHHKSRSFEY